MGLERHPETVRTLRISLGIPWAWALVRPWAPSKALSCSQPRDRGHYTPLGRAVVRRRRQIRAALARDTQSGAGRPDGPRAPLQRRQYVRLKALMQRTPHPKANVPEAPKYALWSLTWGILRLTWRPW